MKAKIIEKTGEKRRVSNNKYRGKIAYLTKVNMRGTTDNNAILCISACRL